MSVPRKHHYVPRIHIKKFKTTAGYSQYMKDKNNFLNPKSSANFFHIKDLNSTAHESGEIDHKSFETELGDKWDSQFNIHFDEIIDLLCAFLETKTLQVLSQETLKFFFEYGIIGKARKMKSNREFNQEFFAMNHVIPDIIDSIDSFEINDDEISTKDVEKIKTGVKELFNTFLKIEERQRKTKFPAMIPSEAKMIVPVNCSYNILIPKSSSFILPDCTSVAFNANEESEWEGIKLNRVLYVGIPLSPNLYIEIFDTDQLLEAPNMIHVLNDEDVDLINLHSYNQSDNQLISIDEIMVTRLKDISENLNEVEHFSAWRNAIYNRCFDRL